MSKYILLLWATSLLVMVLHAATPTTICEGYKEETNAIYPSALLGYENTPTGVAQYLTQHIDHLKLPKTGLIYKDRTESLASYHYHYDQQYQGTPIYQSSITVNVTKAGVVTSIFDNTVDTRYWQLSYTTPEYDVNLALTRYLAQNWSDEKYTIATTPTVGISPSDGQPKSCLLLKLSNHRGKNRELLITTDEILYSRDPNSYLQHDSLVSGMVFNPDPLTTAHTVYGGAYRDYNDSDIVELNAQRKIKSFYTDFENDSFRLKNRYVSVEDLNGDGIIPVVSHTPTFNYTRHQSGFEDVMVFYHINTFRSYFHNLGFTAGDTIVYADSHGTSADNSYFSDGDRQLFYGTGGVDDAEDADVIVHEYTHNLSTNANKDHKHGIERTGLDEGIADYTAASYSKAIDPYNWVWVYNWDGHNEFWSGRVVNYSTKYAKNLSSDIYVYGQIWSSVLMGIQTFIGRPACDSLAYETMYQFADNMTMPQAAQLLYHTDSLLWQGAHHCAIQYWLYRYNLSASDCISADIPVLSPEIFFRAYPSSFQVTTTAEDRRISVYLYDLSGRIVAHYEDKTFIKPDELPLGIYMVGISDSHSTVYHKWALTAH